MNGLEGLMTAEELTPEQLRMLAMQMRGQTATGGQLSTSTIEPVAQQGKLMQVTAQDAAQGIGLQQARAKQIESQRESELLRMAGALQKAQMKAAGKAAKGGGYKDIPATVAAKWEDKLNKRGNVGNLAERWKPEYRGALGLFGDLENVVAKKTRGLIGDEAQSEWWGDWKQMYENIERHELFGSALTTGEQKQWAAANIHPDDSDQLIRSKLTTLNRLNKKLNAVEARNAINKNWDPDYVQGAMANQLSPEDFANLDAVIEGADQPLRSTQLIEERSLQGISDQDLERMILEMDGGVQ